MQSKLVVIINGQPMVEYDRNVRLPGQQRQFLDKMDLDMDQGINLAGQEIDEPDTGARARYIAMHLVTAVMNENDAKISAMCAWLATRLPELKQVKAVTRGEEVEMELVFDREFQNQVTVDFDASMNIKKQ